MWPDPQETADLVTFTEEILNGKLDFLCIGSAVVKWLQNVWTQVLRRFKSCLCRVVHLWNLVVRISKNGPSWKSGLMLFGGQLFLKKSHHHHHHHHHHQCKFLSFFWVFFLFYKTWPGICLISESMTTHSLFVITWQLHNLTTFVT